MILDYVKSTSMVRPLIYGYANARAKSMKSTLLPQKEVESMAEAREVKDVLGLLERTGYKEDIVSSALGYSGADLIELSLGKHLSRTIKKLYFISPKEARKALDGILERYDISNLKTILLGKHLDKPREELEPFLIETGFFSKSETNRLLEAKGVEGVVKALAGSFYADLLDDHLEAYQQEKSLTPMMQALDLHYYRQLPKLIKGFHKDDKLVLNIFKAEVDAKNISNVFRAKQAGLGEEELMKMIFEKGNLSPERVEALVKAKDVEACVNLLKKDYNLLPALEAFKKDNSLIHFEVALDKAIAGQGLKALSRSILSLGSIIGFLFLKEGEVGNIRKIVRAKEYDLPLNKVKEMLVQVS